MALKWKRKLLWMEDGILYIHPIPAVVSIAIAAWWAVELCIKAITMASAN